MVNMQSAKAQPNEAAISDVVGRAADHLPQQNKFRFFFLTKAAHGNGTIPSSTKVILN